MAPDQEAAYCEFVAARLQPLHRLAYLICGDWHRAEDAVQVALTKLYLEWSRAEARAWSDQPATTIEGRHWLEDPLTDHALVSCWSGSYKVSDDGDPPVTTTGIVETQCDTSTAADGSELISVHGDEHWQGRPRSFYSRSWNTVVAFRPDGTAVKAENFCGNEAADDDETNHCFDLQLTIDQLTSIVVNTPPVPAE